MRTDGRQERVAFDKARRKTPYQKQRFPNLLSLNRLLEE
jgi:hypothetical protein